MDAYTGFAEVYDLFMDNVPYEAWSEAIVRTLREYGITEGLLLDLGCGTGTMTALLAEAGYDMIGVDGSEEMLELAMEKQAGREESAEKQAEREAPAEKEPVEKRAVEEQPGEKQNERQTDILYLCQDMREFELYGTVRAAVSVCDSLNYILEEEELLQVFRLVHNYLDPDGLFLFDLNTIYKYEALLAENTIAENREEGSFIWENYYDREERLNEYDLTIYARREDGSYERFEETHYQRAYETGRVLELLREAGLEPLWVRDADNGEAPGEETERVCILARNQLDSRETGTQRRPLSMNNDHL